MTVWKLFDVLFIGTIQAFIFMLLTGHLLRPGPRGGRRGGP